MISLDAIKQHAPGAECIEPMKVWKIPEGREYKFAEVANSGEYFAQLKKDGYWYQFEKTEQGVCYLFSRTVSTTTGILTEKIANVPHIEEALSVIPNGTILIGEIYYPGKTSKAVTRIMGCLAPKAVERQEAEGYIHYYVHDIIKYNGELITSKGAEERYNQLVKLWNDCNLNEFDFLELAQIYTENIQEETAAALNRGEEGMVLKKKDCPYSPGKRPAWHNLKIKKVDYLDAICIGFCDATKEYTGKEIETWGFWIRNSDNMRMQGCYYGEDGYTAVTKGYYYGWKTAIRIGAYDSNGNIKEIGTVASGLTDELREDFAKNPDLYLNQVAMIQCMQVDKEELTCRHAFFKGFRDDKNATECTIESIFN
jgi:ATP-dependent DNA ligase